MADISEYLGLITSEHSDKPLYSATLTAALQPLVDAINAAQSLPGCFDLDQAIGAQLDAVGIRVGITRHVKIPLGGSAGVDLVSLDDSTFRTLIRAKIGANRWDGTQGQSREILDLMFSGVTHVFIEDHQDMSIIIGVSGVIPSALFLALLTGGYIPIKPAGVRTNYIVTSVDGPLFGFDVSNQYIAGFEQGSWGIPL